MVYVRYTTSDGAEQSNEQVQYDSDAWIHKPANNPLMKHQHRLWFAART